MPLDEKSRQNLLCATFILAGLRFDRETIVTAFRKLNMSIEESTTYQGILEEGVIKGERKMILKLGSIKFGPPSDEFLSRLNSIFDTEQLELLGEKFLTCSNWEELFAGS